MGADECPFDGEVPAVRPAKPSAPQPVAESTLERINNTPHGSLKFGDFAKLRSGRDEFTAMGYTALRTAVLEEERQAALTAFPDDASAQSSCLRWILRGLECGKAIRKVQTDLIVTENATKRRR